MKPPQLALLLHHFLQFSKSKAVVKPILWILWPHKQSLSWYLRYAATEKYNILLPLPLGQYQIQFKIFPLIYGKSLMEIYHWVPFLLNIKYHQTYHALFCVGLRYHTMSPQCLNYLFTYLKLYESNKWDKSFWYTVHVLQVFSVIISI